eukprot:g4277.t1
MNGGINALMEAETKAGEIISNARLKAKELKASAAVEAQTEIAMYQREKEEEFAQISRERAANQGGVEQFQVQADADCEVLKTEFEQNKEKCAEHLAKVASANMFS